MGNIRALEIHQAAIARDQAGNDAHHRGFARAIGADEGDHFAFGDFKADGIHDGFAIVFFGEVLHDHKLRPPVAQKQIKEIQPAAHRDEHAHGDGIGKHVLHDQLARHQHDHAEQRGAKHQLAVPECAQ